MSLMDRTSPRAGLAPITALVLLLMYLLGTRTIRSHCDVLNYTIFVCLGEGNESNVITCPLIIIHNCVLRELLCT
ncbi:hypothetical protein XELAEV_18026044mg [Xenopus laevis]|uniref:Uncharacterized protein n=1 Tax=Xenopus laevis TaxID=8355 RepID=A0A974D3H3_XENLA|nr:hypothetical protein XELAEV_18026044mg [Xenopus laevis]